PLIVHEKEQPTRVAARVWQPLVVESVGSSIEQMRNGTYRPPSVSDCVSTFCGTDTCSVLHADYNSLLNVGVDLSWGGCSASPEGRFVVVSATERRGKAHSRSVGCLWARRCSAGLVVFDPAGGTLVPLLDDDQKGTAQFRFAAGTVQWSPDGAFLIAQ